MAATNKKLHREYDSAGNITAKECRKCNSIKPIDAFYTSGKKTVNNIDGHAPLCIECHKARWHHFAKDPEARRRWLLMRIKSKCKKQNIPFDLTLDDLVIPTHCPIFGIPLSFGVKTSNVFRDKRGQVTVPMDSPSVDRIVPEKGYVKGNIVVISYRANLIKTNASVSELIQVADFYKMLTSKA